MPLNTFALIYETIRQDVDIERQLCNNLGIILNSFEEVVFRNKNKNLSLNLKLKLFIDYLQNLGFGTFCLEIVRKNQIIVSSDCVLYELTRNKFMNEKEVGVLNYVECLIKLFIEKHCNKKTEIKVKQDRQKRFIIFNLSNISNDNVDATVIKKIDMKKNFKYNKLLNRIILNKQLKTKNGRMRLWKVNIVIFPLQLFEKIDQRGLLEVKDTIREIGKIQGGVSTELMKKLFGNFFKPTIIKNLIEQVEVVGVGIIENLNIDISEKEIYLDGFFNFSNNSILIEYVNGIGIGCLEYLLEEKCEVERKNNTYRIYSTNIEKNLDNEDISYKEILHLKNFIK